MWFSQSMKYFVAGFLLIFISGCGTCPKLLYDGPMKDEDLAFLRERVNNKNIDLDAIASKKTGLELAWRKKVHGFLLLFCF